MIVCVRERAVELFLCQIFISTTLGQLRTHSITSAAVERRQDIPLMSPAIFISTNVNRKVRISGFFVSVCVCVPGKLEPLVWMHVWYADIATRHERKYDLN